MEFHRRYKKAVEGQGVLLKVLLLVLQVLQQCVGELDKGKSHEGLVEGLLSVLLQIFCWDFKTTCILHVHDLFVTASILSTEPSDMSSRVAVSSKTVFIPPKGFTSTYLTLEYLTCF